MARPAHDRGFTLMEALVAVVIFASASLALQSVFARGGLGLRISSSETRAIEIARTALQKVDYPQATEKTRETTGETDGFTWSATVTRYEPPGGGLLSMKVEAFWIDLELSWLERSQGAKPRTLTLRTLALGKVP